jgi:O-6-methylguanine DNA methyltransferase
MILLHLHPSPVGAIRTATLDGRLVVLDFEEFESRLLATLAARVPARNVDSGPAPRWLSEALERYFDGALDALDDAPLDERGTAFERAVWSTLRTTPAGRTSTYGAVAAALGRPGAARAVGRANGRNPIALFTPCHRIIGASGALVGYGGAPWRKRWLLDFETRHASG